MSPSLPLRALCAIVLSVPLALTQQGCDSGSGSAPPAVAEDTTLDITPSLGLVRNATVVVKDAAGAIVGRGMTGTAGTVSITATGTGPFVIEVQGDGDAEYFDEHTNAFEPFRAPRIIRAAVPTGATDIGVTGLTDIAHALLAGNGAPLTNSNINLANNAVLQTFASAAPAGLTNLLTPPQVLSGAPSARYLGNNAPAMYAAILAGLAATGGSAPTPALTAIEQLRDDAADGSIDGVADGTAIGGLVYTPGSFAADFAGKVTSVVNTWGFPALQTTASTYNVTALVEPSWELGGTPVIVSGFTPASAAAGANVTINGSGFDSDLFHMQVFFSNNIAATVISSSETQLVVQVPVGAVSGPLRVTNTLTGRTSADTASFTITGGGGGGGSWTSRASPSGYVLTALAYGGGRFIAAGMGKTILSSADGLSWTARTGPDNDWFQANAVTHDGTRFILVGDTLFNSPQPALIATSPDGITWTRRTFTASIAETQLTDVAAGGGTLTVVGLNGIILSSGNAGVSWTEETQSAAAAFHGVASNGTTRVAVGHDNGYNGVILVNTGSTWSSAAGVTGFYPRDVVWTGEQFVAVGGANSNGDADPVVMTSQNGSNWTRYALTAGEASTGKPLQEVTWDATASKLYASGNDFGSNHVIVSSSNGSNWTLEYQGSATGNGALNGIAASPTRVVTVGGTRSVTRP